MRLTAPSRSARLGRVRIRSLQRVIELDSGGPSCSSPFFFPPDGDVASPSAVRSVSAQMAIVVPCMDEETSTIEGVLSGIPHDSLVILVSNSKRGAGDGGVGVPGKGADKEGKGDADAYGQEVEALHRFCRVSRRSALVVHQRDPGLAKAFRVAGMAELVDDSTGLVWPGKGEAMLIGTALAAATGRRYVGFIDADNFVPGSVREYCEAFAAGLHLAQGGRQRGMAMVRLSWRSKPKVREGKLEFNREGRSSRVTNRWLNQLLSPRGGTAVTGENTDIIATGNAGEHAMSLELGVKMRFAGGFAVEPFQFLDLLEQFGGKSPSGFGGGERETRSGVRLSPGLGHGEPYPQRLVEVLQIETRNPHFHQDKGPEHVRDMWAQALAVIYHSPVTPEPLRRDIAAFMCEQKVLPPGETEPRRRARVYPPIETLDLGRLWDLLCGDAPSLQMFGDPLGGAFEVSDLTLGVVSLLENVRESIWKIIRSLLLRARSGRMDRGRPLSA